MKSTKILKGACVAAVASMLPLSQAAMADVNISGWINEGITFYDDGVSSDAVQISDNGTTLGSRITFSGSTDLANSGLTAGFEVILEPTTASEVLGWGTGAAGVNDDANGSGLIVLGNSINVGGAWGKVTVGLQSMPTDNIAVLEDPSLTLWSSISPVFKGIGVGVTGLGAGAAAGSTWGSFLQCFMVPGLGIGIDCNGIYRNGIRYDLPAFGPVTVAVGYANDDIYDIAAKYKGQLGRLNSSIALGYAINQGAAGAGSAGAISEAENFQVQAGLMDPVTGLYGSIAYQNEEADLKPGAAANTSDDTDAWWIKAGIKKQWLSVGDTSLSFQYGQYSDQYAAAHAAVGVNGSEVERIGFSVDQYFGSTLILYGQYEQLDLDVDCIAGTACATGAYSGSDELDTFTVGLTYFF